MHTHTNYKSAFSIYMVYIWYIHLLYLNMHLIWHVYRFVFRVSRHSSPSRAAVSWHRGQRARRKWWSWFWYSWYTSCVGEIHVEIHGEILKTHRAKGLSMRTSILSRVWRISQTTRTFSFAFCAIIAAVGCCSSTNSCSKTWLGRVRLATFHWIELEWKGPWLVTEISAFPANWVCAILRCGPW